MSENRSKGVLTFIILVAVLVLSVSSLLLFVGQEITELEEGVGQIGDSLSNIEENLGTESFPEAIQPLADSIHEFGIDVNAFTEDVRQRHFADDAARDTELERYRAAEQGELNRDGDELELVGGTVTAEVLSPSEMRQLFGNDAADSGWTSPCLDGCDLGGASLKVSKGVLIAWNDKTYKTTRKNLRVNRNRAGIGRVGRVDPCIEYLTRPSQQHHVDITQGTGESSMTLHAKYPVLEPDNPRGYRPRQDMLRAERSYWRKCR